MIVVDPGANSHVPKPLTSGDDQGHGHDPPQAAERDHRAHGHERHRVGDQVVEAEVQERRGGDPGQPLVGARDDPVLVEPVAEHGVERPPRATSGPPRPSPAGGRSRDRDPGGSACAKHGACGSAKAQGRRAGFGSTVPGRAGPPSMPLRFGAQAADIHDHDAYPAAPRPLASGDLRGLRRVARALRAAGGRRARPRARPVHLALRARPRAAAGLGAVPRPRPPRRPRARWPGC